MSVTFLQAIYKYLNKIGKRLWKGVVSTLWKCQMLALQSRKMQTSSFCLKMKKRGISKIDWITSTRRWRTLTKYYAGSSNGRCLTWKP